MTPEPKTKPSTPATAPKREPVLNPLYKLSIYHTAITLRQKGNNDVITGRVKWFRKNWLKLTNVKVVPTNPETRKVFETDWILVDAQTIAAVWPVDDARRPGEEQIANGVDSNSRR